MSKEIHASKSPSSVARKRSRVKIVLISLAAGAVVVVLALPLLNQPPQQDADKHSIARFVASPEFSQTPPDAKAQYMHRLLEDPQAFSDLVQDKSMPREEKQRLLHEVFSGQMVDRAERYQQASMQDKKKLLDDIIGDQERNAKAGKSTAAGAQAEAELTNRPAWTPEGMKAEIEHMPSEQRIKIAALMKGVADRRSERGMAQSDAAPVSVPHGK